MDTDEKASYDPFSHKLRPTKCEKKPVLVARWGTVCYYLGWRLILSCYNPFIMT